MIPCVSLTETSVLGNMKERVKEMRVFGCRLNFWNNITATLTTEKGLFILKYTKKKYQPQLEKNCIYFIHFNDETNLLI